ncbi:MAG: hypothetical protein IT438_16800 [Phycisphaerales bacterium]|nr:hypothetical protein [Phycisphaerales bacterium]
MSKPAICYLERAGGGSFIRRVRLMAEGGGAAPFDRSWTAPSVTAAPSSEAAASDAVSTTRAAARWVAETLGQLGTRELSHVCVDPDGALCTWLSATSADPATITATLMQPEVDDGTGAGGGSGSAARLLSLGAGSSSGFSPDDASVQALATLDPPGTGSGISARLLSRRSAGALGIDAQRSRYAVMAVPDAPVRVFLDELDARGLEVRQVTSLWHAMAAAWDPAAQDSAFDESGRVVSSFSPSSAVVVVDPVGRLVWAWSHAGQLVAGGAMRLRSAVRRASDAEAETADDQATARRVGAEHADQTVLEFTEAETGRLVMDWLSWSAQLGHCPQQVACIGPAPATDASTGQPDPSLIGQSLGRAWPGATIGVGIHADPIGATLLRLTAATPGKALNPEAAVAVGPDDPRSALVGLSSRPGKADRGMYAWKAIGIVGAALIVGAVGYQLHASARGSAAAISDANDTRKAALESVEEVIRGITLMRPRDATDSLASKTEEFRKQMAAMKPPKPFVEEIARVFEAMKDHDEVKVNAINIGPVSGTVDLITPDIETGPAIVTTLIKLPGVLIRWQGTNVPGRPPTGPGKFIISGPVISEEKRPGGGA